MARGELMLFVRSVPKIQGDQSIAKLIPVTIGGIKQWIYIRGKNRTRPILLMIHGGPGTAQIGFIRKYQQALEEQFVVVQWDQRGAGLSYAKNIPLESMTVDQFVQDAVEVTKYVLDLLEAQQLYLVGHSWGTIIGMLAIADSSHLYKRYFGIAQVANVKDSEDISYVKMLELSIQNQDEKAHQRLSEIGPPPWKALKDDRVHQKYLEKLGGGITRDGKMVNKLLIGLLLSKEYTFLDVIRTFKGMYFSMNQLQTELLHVDLANEIKKVDIPIYFLMGRHDLIAPYEPTEEFFKSIKAPEKNWRWFNNAAHTPNIEEPEKFLSILVAEIEKDIID